jgi:hypothetical protein
MKLEIPLVHSMLCGFMTSLVLAMDKGCHAAGAVKTARGEISGWRRRWRWVGSEFKGRSRSSDRNRIVSGH